MVFLYTITVMMISRTYFHKCELSTAILIRKSKMTMLSCGID